MKHPQNSRDAASLAPPPLRTLRSLLSSLVGSWKSRIQAPHQLDGIINRIASRNAFSRAGDGQRSSPDNRRTVLRVQPAAFHNF
jgi:hypothetical protein